MTQLDPELRPNTEILLSNEFFKKIENKIDEMARLNSSEF